MPTYEYLCSDCGKTFETIQKITENPLDKCELCGGSHVKRLISPTAFHLKGSGWYKTDYGSTGSGASSSSSSSSSTSSKSDTETKTETKSEPAAESKPASTPEKKPAAGE